MRGKVFLLGSVLCLMAVVANLWIAMTFAGAMEDNRIRALVVPSELSSGGDIRAVPMRMPAIDAARRESLLKNLIVEYVVARYTLTGSPSGDVFESTASYDLGRGALLKLPSLNDEGFEAAYKGVVAEAAERKTLSDSRATRMVEIIGEPRKYKDMWIVEADFIYKSPATWRLADARRERVEIQMEVEPITDFRLAHSAVALNLPSALFDWKVKWVKKSVK